ncbi:MAG: plastocyanin/azurin family copper-binding protein [Chloroflexi bacterium]|nr:plastocyanin/azurin family copper-binding protein [Chloroflexota bacterium]
MSGRLGLLGGGLVLSGALLIGAGTMLGGGFAAGSMMGGGFAAGGPSGMMGGSPGGMMGGGMGMMGGYGSTSAAVPGPGEAGFVAGTTAAPRVVRVVAGPGYAFSPSTITVARGETVTFEVTSVGGLIHEFMIGPADAVAVDTEGTPEVADIGMMQTKSVTYTFDGDGPYAFACNATGHYEGGMRGAITLVN